MTDSWEQKTWRWDPSLYEGSASFYARGRVAYPAALVDQLVTHLDLDGHGRLLDVGCGPGSLTLPLSRHFEHVVGVDADAQMLVEAERRARAARIGNIEWVHARAEDLTLDQGTFLVATLAQSFHWMDRAVVAGLLRTLLDDCGAVAYVHATTHKGVDGTTPLTNPRPPWAQIDALVRQFLGHRRRAGQGFREAGEDSEEDRGKLETRIFRAAGFTGPTRLGVPAWAVTRSADQVVASVFSLSYAAPHLFGAQIGKFEHELRTLLSQVSPTGEFSEQMREIAVDVWIA